MDMCFVANSYLYHLNILNSKINILVFKSLKYRKNTKNVYEKTGEMSVSLGEINPYKPNV